MRLFASLRLCVFALLAASAEHVFAQAVMRPASQSAVNAGTDRVNAVTPYTLTNADWIQTLFSGGGGGGLTVGQLATTNYIPRLLVSDATPQDPYRWMNMTNGFINFPAWSSARIVGSQVPGIFFSSITNGATLGQIDVQHDHGAAGRSEMRFITAWDMAIVPGYNSGCQLGASTENWNNYFYLQYANRVGWSHLFSFRTYTNGQSGSSAFAMQGRRDSTSTNLNHLQLFAREPVWNNYPTTGFSDAGILLADLDINGSTFHSTLNGPLLWATNRVQAGVGTRWGNTDGGLEVTGGYNDSLILGGDTGAATRTDGSTKNLWMTMPPKNSAEAHLNIMKGASDGASSALDIGGGTSVKASFPTVRIWSGGGGVANGAGSLGMTFAGSIITATNLLAPQYDFTTNAGTMNPDFAFGSTWIQTNAAFALLAPKNVDTTRDQVTVFNVTNSTAAAVAITAPANVFARGVWYVTNVTSITLRHHGAYFTNATADPIW